MQCLKEVSLGRALALQLVMNCWSDEKNKEFFSGSIGSERTLTSSCTGVCTDALGIPGGLIHDRGPKRLWWKRRCQKPRLETGFGLDLRSHLLANLTSKIHLVSKI